MYTYMDKASKEEATSVVKEKYKLLWNFSHLEEVLIFFVSTKNSNAVRRRTSLIVNSSEWENNINPSIYLTKTSYIDVRKAVSENIDELSNKKEVGDFFCVAKLPKCKYKELQRCYENFLSDIQNSSNAERKILCDLSTCIPIEECKSEKVNEFIRKYM